MNVVNYKIVNYIKVANLYNTKLCTQSTYNNYYKLYTKTYNIEMYHIPKVKQKIDQVFQCECFLETYLA